MAKLVFLDMDGVMNSLPFRKNYYDNCGQLDAVSHHAVGLLNSLLEDDEDVFLVLSSDWRIEGLYGYEKTISRLKMAGFKYPERFLGYTKDFCRPMSSFYYVRWEECVDWVDKVAVEKNLLVDAFVCLDDSRFLFTAATKKERKRHLVITDDNVGLTQADVDKIKEKLNAQCDS